MKEEKIVKMYYELLNDPKTGMSKAAEDLAKTHTKELMNCKNEGEVLDTILNGYIYGTGERIFVESFRHGEWKIKAICAGIMALSMAGIAGIGYLCNRSLRKKLEELRSKNKENKEV